MTVHIRHMIGARVSADAFDGGAVPEATDGEVNAACREAAAAWPDYRGRTLEDRAAFLDRAATEIEAVTDELVETMPAETALPEGRVRGELARTVGQLRLFATVVRRGDFLGARIDRGDAERTPPRPDIRQYRVPRGPVAVFGASNFPLAFSVAGGDTASALASGCPVVVKAHPGHPATSAIVAAALRRAVVATGMPDGVFNIVYGGGNAVGAAVVQHPDITAVAFTGSFRGGSALARLAQERAVPIPVFAEMGSVNPMFLLPERLASAADELAGGYVGSVTLGGGQFCTNPGVVFAVTGDGLERFCDAVAREVAEREPAEMLHPGIQSAYEAGVERLAGIDGVRAVAAGGTQPGRTSACVFRVTRAAFEANPALAEEVFGPASLIVELDSAEEMPPVAAALPGQLTATVHGADGELARAGALVDCLTQRAGRVLFNGFPTGVEVCDAMVHGGPWPATTDSATTSVGTLAMERFLRPVCFQDCPAPLLPSPLRDDNPLGLRRLVDGEWSDAALPRA